MTDMKPKHISEITVADLETSRWCYFYDDENGYDCFQHVVPDSHPSFSTHVIEVELAYFEFFNGKTLKGLFDGSETFSVFSDGAWHSFWYGVGKPSQDDISRFGNFLAINQLQLPVVAKAKWSEKSAKLNGLQYIGPAGTVIEVLVH